MTSDEIGKHQGVGYTWRPKRDQVVGEEKSNFVDVHAHAHKHEDLYGRDENDELWVREYCVRRE